jgi:hypothetical protein
MAMVPMVLYGFRTVPDNRNSIAVQGIARSFVYGSLCVTPSTKTPYFPIVVCVGESENRSQNRPQTYAYQWFYGFPEGENRREPYDRTTTMTNRQIFPSTNTQHAEFIACLMGREHFMD